MEMINNANAVLFDLCTRLKDNGVVAKVSGDYEFSEDNISLDFVERISELDFTEHDKRFKDEINRLKENIKERDSYIKQLKHDADELKEVLTGHYDVTIKIGNNEEKRVIFDLKKDANAENILNYFYKNLHRFQISLHLLLHKNMQFLQIPA